METGFYRPELDVGAVRKGVLRRAFLRHGQYHDQALWSILDTDWLHAHARLADEASVTIH